MLSVTSIVVKLGALVSRGSLGDIWGVGARLCRRGLPSVLRCLLKAIWLPTWSHSPYGLGSVFPSYGWGHRIASWPTFPHWKHTPTSRSYLYATLMRSLFGLTTCPPLRSGCSIGISTQICRKRAWFEESALHSTSTTLPIPRPISSPAFSLIRSKGRPQTWTYIGKLLNRTILVIILFSHLYNANLLFLKLHGLLSHTHCSWLSNENLNCNMPSPTSTIFSRRFFVALMLKGRVVMNFPMRLREYSSRISSLRAAWIVIGSSSSDVSDMFWIRLMKSESI